MKHFCVFLLLTLFSVRAYADEYEDSVAVAGFLLEINSEKEYIVNNVEGYDPKFITKLEYFQYNLAMKPYAYENKRKYFSNLLNFVHIIATSTDAKEKFKSGFYMEALDFFPSIVAYSENNELEKLLSTYPAKTLKSIPILFNEKALKTVLYEIAMKDPDLFYKYLYELFTLPYIRKYVEGVAIYAPISAKKYIFSSNYVSYYLESSQVPAVKVLYDIKRTKGANAKSYILTNAIINEAMPIEQAEELCLSKENLAKKLLATIQTPNHIGTYSINKELELLSLFTLRDYRINGSSAISHLSNKELVLTLIYGGKELTSESVAAINAFMRYRKGELVTMDDLKFIPIKNLSYFVNICDQFNQIELINKVFEPQAREYLFTKMNFEQEVKYSLKNHDMLQRPSDFDPEPISDSMQVEEEINPSVKITAKKIEISPYNFPKIELQESDRKLLTWTKNLNQSIDNLADIIEEENGVAFLDYLCQYYPDEVFASINDIYRKNYCSKYIAKAAINAPNSAKRYLMNPANPVNLQLSVSRQPEVKAIYNIFNKYAMQSKSYYLLDEVVKQNENIDRLHELAKDKIQFIKKLAKILLDTQPYGRYSASKEMGYEALRIIREINGANEGDLSDANKYGIIQQLTAEEIYALMIYGQEELFRNSFNGIYTIFKSKLTEQNALRFFEKVNYTKFRVFLSLCNTFDKWNDFTAFLNIEEQHQLYEKLIVGIDKEDDYIGESVVLADLLQNMKKQEARLQLQNLLKIEFEKAANEKNKRAIAIYGLLASIVGDNAVVEQDWYRSIAQEYKLPPLTSLNVKDLINSQGKVIEHCFFYDDEDGRSSYVNFIANYKNSPDWFLEDFSTYVRISSRSGAPIEIYANKPDAEFSGQQAITNLFKEKDIYPSIIIHRGHSYHTEKTIRQIIKAPKFIFLGSCGGFYKISLALERAPDAQTLATKQIGSKSVNDPVFKSFNEELRRGQNINWKNFWGTMETRLSNNHLFHDYVPPHKNISALFIRAYYYLVGI